MRITVDASELPGPEEEEEQAETAVEGGEEGEEESVEEAGQAQVPRSLVDQLASFLGEKLGCEALVEGREIHLEVEEEKGIRRRVRQLLKKFLYKQGLTDDFRVISAGGGGFKIKRRRFPRLKSRAGWA